MRHTLSYWIVAASLAGAHELPRSVAARLEIRWPQSAAPITVKIRAPLAAVPSAASFPRLGSGFLDFERTGPLLNGAVAEWVAQSLQWKAGGIRLEGTPRIISAHLTLEADHTPVRNNDTKVYWSQVVLEAILEYPFAQSQPGSPTLAVDWLVSREDLAVQTEVEFTRGADGVIHRFRYDGNIGPLALNPSALETAMRFMAAGSRVFISNPDLLCLLTALLLPIGKRWRRSISQVLIPFLLALPMAFGWTHSIHQPIWWPSFTGFALASVVFYGATESAAYPQGWRWRWILSFLSGLIAGMAISTRFAEIVQFAAGMDGIASASYMTGSIVAAVATGFTAGIASRLSAKWRFVRFGAYVLIAHAAWHSTLEYGGLLAKYDLLPSRADTGFWAAAVKTAFALTVAAAVAWVYGLVLRSSRTRSSPVAHAR